jgi:hypothetical protein
MFTANTIITVEYMLNLIEDDIVYTNITKITDISEITEEYLINLIAENEEWNTNYLIDLYCENYIIDLSFHLIIFLSY